MLSNGSLGRSVVADALLSSGCLLPMDRKETQGTLGRGEKSGKLGRLSNPLGLATVRISILEA